jgi:hypothetical protein
MDIINIAKIITILWFYGMGGFVLVAKINGANTFIKILLKATTVMVMVYVTLLLFGQIKI